MKVRITFRYNGKTVEAYALLMGTMLKLFGSYKGIVINQVEALKIETL